MIFLLILIIVILALSIRIVQQYEQGVVFRLGRINGGPREPGLRLIIPIIDVMKKVDMRIVTLPVQSQKIITKDNVSIDVAAVAYFHVDNSTKTLVAIENIRVAISQIALTTVRNVVGQSSLDQVLSNTDNINTKVKEILFEITEKWGVVISAVELKDIQLPESMQRAMAKEAEAEREKRAKVIAAEGEQLSATKLGEAADIISKHPIALQLRNLQVLSEIATEKNSTIVFPSQLLDSVHDIKRFVNKEEAA